MVQRNVFSNVIVEYIREQRLSQELKNKNELMNKIEKMGMENRNEIENIKKKYNQKE